MRPVHGRAVVDDQHVPFAPDVVIDDLGPNHPLEEIGHVCPTGHRCHAGDVRGLREVEVHRYRPVHGMRAYYRMLAWLAGLLSTLRARDGVTAVCAGYLCQADDSRAF